MKVLVIDIGGSHVKVLVSGQEERRAFVSGPRLTPRAMVAGVRKLTADWRFDAVSIGYPGPVRGNRPAAEPHNLGRGWVRFKFQSAFRRPLKMMNDAAMQALGCYRRGKMLFLGLGTGLGSCLIIDRIMAPLELGHLPYKNKTFEDYVGLRGLEKYGKKKWRRYVADVVKHLTAAIEPDDVVLGGGNVKKLKALPPGCRVVNNSKAFLGGLRLWESRPASSKPSRRFPARHRKKMARRTAMVGHTRPSIAKPSAVRTRISTSSKRIVTTEKLARRPTATRPTPPSMVKASAVVMARPARPTLPKPQAGPGPTPLVVPSSTASTAKTPRPSRRRKMEPTGETAAAGVPVEATPSIHPDSGSATAIEVPHPTGSSTP